MTVKVTIASGKFNISMPDGNIYQAGDTVILTDEQWDQIPASAKSALLTGATATVAVTDSDSEANSPTAVVDAAGHTAIGDAHAQDESTKPTKDTTYG
jgi:hypothetical protein